MTCANIHRVSTGDLRTSGQVSAREDQQELFPTPASGQVDVSERLPEERGEISQERVPGGMPIAVVDILEPIEVRDHDREGSAETVDAGKLVREGLLALPAIRQTGQAVHQSLSLDDPVQT